MTRFTKQKSKRGRNILIGTVIFLFVTFLVVGGVYGMSMYNAYSKASVPKVTSSLRSTQVSVGSDAVSVLLMGVEDYATGGEGGRADSLLLLTINPTTKDFKILSIPRDSRVFIPAEEPLEDKINHSYAYGKEELTVRTVESMLQIPIDYYVKVGFSAFKDGIDVLGGIDVDVPFSFSVNSDVLGHAPLQFSPGMHTLNGEQALGYVRMRKDDPNGDFGRTERQRQVIMSAMNKVLATDTLLTKWNSLLDVAADNIKTNIPLRDLVPFASTFTSIGNDNMETLTLEGENERIDGIYYFLPDPVSVGEVVTTLKKHLEIEY
ncbi:MAG: LCP family protein [Bacilli bacterium]